MIESDVEKLLEFIKTGGVTVRENYVIPGLRSLALLENKTTKAMLRIFEMTREQEYYITPHNHRYDFECLVLEGVVENIVYTMVPGHMDPSHVVVPYNEDTHTLDHERATFTKAYSNARLYSVGDWYRMTHDQFHSIKFGSGTRVLFLQGDNKKNQSHCLLPYVNGRICDTFLWKDWMMTPEKE